MRYTLPTNRESGFTLIELLVIAPVIILAIAGFIALMISLVGDVLQSRDRSTLAFENQDALDRIEQDVRLSTQFLTTTGNQQQPQGSNNNFTGTSPFTSSGAFILGQLATDKNPTDPTRKLIYYANQPNNCGPDQTYNRLLINKVIYFIKGGSLWRRVVVPNYNTNAIVDDNTVCSAPWQRDTCSPGYTISPPCQTNDTELMRNVSNFSVKYYSDPTSSTDLGSSGALAASTVEVTLTGSKTTAGKQVTSSGTMRVTKLNSVDVDIPAPGTPSVSYALSGPASVVFSWPTVPNATSYIVQYNVNGGSTQTTTLGGQTTSFSVNANRNDTVSISVRARNSAGQSANPGTATMTMPAWTDLPLASPWETYSDTYSSPQFTRTSDGVVFLKGLVKSGTGSVTEGSLVGTLPPGYRPEEVLVFQTSTSPNVAARVDVWPNGEITVFSGNKAWVSLDMIHFIPDTPTGWTNASYPGNWSNYGGIYEDVHYRKDSTGRVHIQGLARAGTTTQGTVITDTMTSANRPTELTHFAAGSTGWSHYWISTTGQTVKRGSQTPGYMGLNAMYYPGSTAGGSGWQTVPKTGTSGLQNGWQYYNEAGGNYSIPQYIKASDGVVTVRGVIKSGSNGVNMFTLPVGYRPAKDQIITVPSSEDYGRIDVRSNGQVTSRAVGAWTALNFSFIADQ